MTVSWEKVSIQPWAQSCPIEIKECEHRCGKINADVVIKGTKVDGVYTDDPMINKNAQRYEKLSYKEVIEGELRVMDLTAITLCKENNLPIIVFDIVSDSGLLDIMNSHSVGTIVS